MKQKQKRKEETMKAELGYKPQKKGIRKIYILKIVILLKVTE